MKLVAAIGVLANSAVPIFWGMEGNEIQAFLAVLSLLFFVQECTE